MTNEPHNDLRSVQEWLQSAITSPEAPQEPGALVADSSRLPAAAHLAIYRRGYIARLLECLGQQFRVLKQTLGAELFDAFAADYLATHPSASYTLNDLGARFPDFLEATRPDAEARESWIDFMIGLAQFEWAVFRMFDQPGQEGKPYADANTPDAALRLQPCFALHRFNFPVAAYYRLANEDELPEHPPEQETYVALVRKDFRTGIYELKQSSYIFLRLLEEGKTIGEVLEQVREETGATKEEVEKLWARWKVRWTEAGFFGINN